jgi:hypothetical protein
MGTRSLADPEIMKHEQPSVLRQHAHVQRGGREVSMAEPARVEQVEGRGRLGEELERGRVGDGPGRLDLADEIAPVRSVADDVGVTLELRLPENPAEMKVAVARGAIAASSPQAWPQAYLPAGIAFTENAPGRYRVAWSDPIGPGRDDDSAAARAIDAGVHFEFDELGARLERSPVFAETGCAPDCSASDGEIRRALADSENRVPGTVGQMIVRGPLQVLLEKVWIPGSS